MKTLRISLIAPAAILLVAACTTAPPVEDGAPVAAAMASAEALPDPYQKDAAYSVILSRDGLSEEQRVRALFARASLRRQAGDNRRGAVADFEEMLALAPEHELAKNAAVELGYTRADITKIEGSMKRLLTLSDWFDKAWVLGDHDMAATRHQKSRLSPNPEQVQKLKTAGYICGNEGEGGPVYQLGDMRSDLTGLNWCRKL